MATSDTNLSQLIIHELTKEQYEALTPEPNQLYLTPDESLTADDLKTINGTSVVGSGDIAVQPTLVSGTNIKTINGNSILGSGNVGVGTVTSVNNVSPVNGNVNLSIPTESTVSGWGFTKNTGTVTSVNNVSPVNGNVTLNIPSAVTESTVSGWGFTKNTGTVTSVNNISPIDGNVTLTIPSTDNLANKDLSNLTTTGNSKFQAPLVSGTNIKTINSTSILGSGNVAVQPTLVSGTNIKTINGTSLLGSGNLEVDSLPSQTSQSGKFLTTNGTSASWATITMPTVDQTYDATSANAQSGVAIASAGFLTSITSSDVTTALGYTPYNSTNPNNYTSVVESTVSGWGFTKNTGTVTSVNNVSPVNGNVTIEIPDSATWGNITGTLSNQTDLKNVLDGKYDASNPNNYTSVVESTVSGWGFTKNTGTVTSVNNVSPVNGNVTVNSLLIRDYTAS